jgi:hypothetical protein
MGVLFLTLQCKQQEKRYTFKRVELNSGVKELLDKYIEYSNLPEGINEISLHKRISKDKDIYTINSGKLTNVIINNASKEDSYGYFYKDYYGFISSELNQFFNQDGLLKIPQLDVKMIYENEDKLEVPYSTYDIISSWEFEIVDGKVSNFTYQFCVLTENQIKEIESINF